MVQGFTLKQIADRNHVSKSTVKSFAATHGFKPIDKSGNAYIYSADLMAVVAEKYGEPANSAKLFNQAVSATNNGDISGLKKQVDQLSDFVGWWADLDDQKLVSVYVYRYIFNSKIIRFDSDSIKILRFFGDFSLNPQNRKMEQAVKSGAFKYFAWRFYRILSRPANEYVMMSRWSKRSDDDKHAIVRQLGRDLSRNYKAYRELKTGSTGFDVKGAGVKTPANSAGSSSSSESSDSGRCKSALLADSKKSEKGA